MLYFKLNILKYELNPDDKRIYCDGFGYCQECPFDSMHCTDILPKQIKFMKEVVEKSKMYFGGL